MRLSAMLLLLGCLVGCQTTQYALNSYSAEGEAAIAPGKQTTPAEDLRIAIQTAHVNARDKLMVQLTKMQLADGRSVEEAAVRDTYLRSRLMDVIRAGHEAPNSRVVTDKDVKLTVFIDKAEIDEILRDYPARAR